MFIKNYGLKKSGFYFTSKDSQLRLSNVVIEVDEDVYTRNGSIYVEGPTTFILKNHTWTFDQLGTLSVDGVTLWKDFAGASNYGDILFEDLNKNRAFINDGTIASAALRAHFLSLNGGRLIVDGTCFHILGGINGSYQTCGRSILASPINLSGGTLTLGGDLMFSSGTKIISSGYWDPIGHAFILGGDITLPDGVDLKFTTSGIIDGQGHSWIFGHNSKIRFDNYITVTFRNITLQKVRDYSDGNASISILGPWRSRLVFQNAEICLADNFSLTQGQMFIHGDVKVSGTSQFNYTTTQVSWITKNSTWMFDFNTTFSYDPHQTGWSPSGDEGKRLIMMEDRTSGLFLNGATLRSTTTGLVLTKGTLVLDHRNYIYNQDSQTRPATSVSQAVTFGDGVTEENDLNIEILPGGNIELMSGILNYRNSI